jgi:hypothetical protein
MNETSSELVRFFPGPQFHVPPVETISVEVLREQRGHFNIIRMYPSAGLETQWQQAETP